MHLSIKRINRIATKEFGMFYLSTEDLLDIQNEVMNSYKVKMHQEFNSDNFGLQFYINNVLTGLKIMLPFSIIVSSLIVVTLNANLSIIFINILCAIGGLVVGTFIFGIGIRIIELIKEYQIINQKLIEVLIGIDYKNYQQGLRTYSEIYSENYNID